MASKEAFIEKGFSILEPTEENKLLAFLKQHYPSVIQDGEVDLAELKLAIGLPVDEKVNGYGLNFVGRNFARAKYIQQTAKELQLNAKLSKNIDTTQNLVLKGDNLDSLKILKHHYRGKIKCIYIDPPYNTSGDNFVYPDRFDKEETEVLGLTRLADDDFARMEFSFKTKKSHNGWLSFMYPRLLLARDLLRDDGVIFISIDDNEQANLKLLCDEIFGEENILFQITLLCNPKGRSQDIHVANCHEYLLGYSKTPLMKGALNISKNGDEIERDYKLTDSKGAYRILELRNTHREFGKHNRINLYYPFYVSSDGTITLCETPNTEAVFPDWDDGFQGCWTWSSEKADNQIDELVARKVSGKWKIYRKSYAMDGDTPVTKQVKSIWSEKEFHTEKGQSAFNSLFHTKTKLFQAPKAVDTIRQLLLMGATPDSTILDFFAGSGTTGHAVMQLNAEDGGNRKFILCQVDEPISENKPAHQFCLDNNLPPVISSITIERLKRAGEKIAQEVEAENRQGDLLGEQKKLPDIGFKVFDCVDAPKVEIDEHNQAYMPELKTDTISRIYNLVFKVGVDEPTQVPEEIVEDCIYRVGHNIYITNGDKPTRADYENAVALGRNVFIDAWTASLNATIQLFKDDVKIVL